MNKPDPKELLKARLAETFENDTQEVVARKLMTTQGNVSKWLNGQIPTTDNLLSISKAYKVSVDWLLGISDEKEIDGGVLEKLTYEHALEALGASDTDTFLSLFDAIGRGDAGKCLDVTEGVVMRGLELSQFVNDFTWFLRNMLLLIATPDAGERIDLPEADVKLMKEAVEKSREEKVLYYINVMSDLSSKMRYSTGKRVLFEATLIRLCHPEKENDNGAIMQRLDVLEAKLESGTFVNNTNADDGSEEHFNAKAPVGKAGPKNIVDKAMPEDYQRIVDNFPEIVAGFGHIGPLFLNNVDCYYNNTKGELTIAFKSLQDHDTINYDTVKTAVQEKFDEFVGKHVKIALVMSKDLTQNDDEFIRAAGMINPNILEVES